MLNKILYHFCSEEIKLVLKRMEDRPSDFMRNPPDVRPELGPFAAAYGITLTASTASTASTAPKQSDSRWRMLVECGVFSRYESYVLRRRLRQIDIEDTRQSVYEVLILK